MNRCSFLAVRMPVAACLVAAMLGCQPADAPPETTGRAPAATPTPPSHPRPMAPQDAGPKPLPARRAQQRLAQVGIAADGGSLQIATAVHAFALPIDQIFADPVRRIERVAILGQEDRGERFDLLLRVEASSDPDAERGRCRKGREVTLQNLAFDAQGGTVGNSAVIVSCLNRIRLAGERRLRDGRTEYALSQRLPDGSHMEANLVYDLSHPGGDTEL